MREILFRGRTFGRGQWVYGLPFQNYGSKVIDGIANKKYEVYAVQPATVGQYTGFEIKGKKVFEGDIICNTLDDDGEINKEYFLVVYDKDEYGFCGQSMDFDNIGLWELEEGEIIGNIHDNPEFLEIFA